MDITTQQAVEELERRRAKMAQDELTRRGEKKRPEWMDTVDDWMSPISALNRFAVKGITMNQADKMVAGISELAGTGDYDKRLEEERAQNKALSEEHPILTTGAEVLGNIGSFGKLGKGGLTLAGQASKRGVGSLPKAIANVGDAAIAGGLYALGADQDVAEAATRSGGITAGLSAIPIAGKPIAKALSKRRVKATVDPKSGGFTPLNIAAEPGSNTQYMYQKVIPNAFGGRGVLNQSEEALTQAKKAVTAGELKANSKLINAAMPEGSTTALAGQKGVEKLQQAHTKAYSDAWDTAKNLSDDAVADLLDIFKNVPKAFKNSVKPLQAKLKEAIKGGDKDAFKRFDDEIKTLMRSSGGGLSVELNAIAKNIKDTFRGGLSSKTQEMLAAIDKLHPAKKLIQSAASSKPKNKGVFSTDDAYAAVKKTGNETTTSTGVAPLQKAVEKEADVLAPKVATVDKITKSMPTSEPGVLNRLAANSVLMAPLAPVMGLLSPLGSVGFAKGLASKGGQRAIAGQANWQRNLAQGLRKKGGKVDNAIDRFYDTTKALTLKDDEDKKRY